MADQTSRMLAPLPGEPQLGFEFSMPGSRPSESSSVRGEPLDANTRPSPGRTANPKRERGGESSAHAAPAADSSAGASRAARRATPSRRGATAESMAKQQREISVSEFFTKNRHLLGFDNKRKALLTTVKEAVDNSLDACEEAGILPDVDVRIEQTDEDRFRVTVRDNGPGIVKGQIPNVFGKLLYGSKFHRLKMSRGQQGIGISAAGMYGLITTGKPIKIISRTGARAEAHLYRLAIDTQKNKPDIISEETVEVDWPHGTEVCIELSATYQKGRASVDEYLELVAIANPHARMTYHPPGQSAVEFPRATEELPRETKEIKPHPHGIELGMLMKMLKQTECKKLGAFLQTEFCRVSPGGAGDLCEKAGLTTATWVNALEPGQIEKLYRALQEAKLKAPPTDCLAPIGAEGILKGLLKEIKAEFYTATTRDPAVYRGNPFQLEVGIAYGGELGRDASDVVEEQTAEALYRTPTVRERSSGSEALNRTPTVRERSSETAAPSKAATVSARSTPLREASTDDVQARVIRFANRVPLLYQQSGCALYKSVVDMTWNNYGLSQSRGALPRAPMLILIHMASVWVPFTSEGKEAIADYDEIRKEVKLALSECGRKLNALLKRKRTKAQFANRRNVFTRYIEEVVEATRAMTRVNKDDLRAALVKLSNKYTEQADMQFDEHGKVVKQAAMPGNDLGLADTIVVDRGSAAEPGGAEGLLLAPMDPREAARRLADMGGTQKALAKPRRR